MDKKATKICTVGPDSGLRREPPITFLIHWPRSLNCAAVKKKHLFRLPEDGTRHSFTAHTHGPGLGCRRDHDLCVLRIPSGPMPALPSRETGVFKLAGKVQ